MPPKDVQTSTLTGRIANLTIGPDGKQFIVHSDLLCERSPYFDHLLRDKPSSSSWSSDSLHLPHDDPVAFADFILWLYTGTLDPTTFPPPSPDQADNPDRILRLFRLWELAGRYEVPELQTLSLRMCEETLEADPVRLISVDAVWFAYRSTSAGSALRQMAIRIWADRASSSRILETRDRLPAVFVNHVDDLVFGPDKEICFRRDRMPSWRDKSKRNPFQIAVRKEPREGFPAMLPPPPRARDLFGLSRSLGATTTTTPAAGGISSAPENEQGSADSSASDIKPLKKSQTD